MSTEKTQIIEMIDKLQNVVDLFYQQNDNEAFTEFELLIDNIENSINILQEYANQYLGFEVDEEKIYNILNEAMVALEEGDKVLMADILQYEFIEYIKELLVKMQ